LHVVSSSDYRLQDEAVAEGLFVRVLQLGGVEVDLHLMLGLLFTWIRTTCHYQVRVALDAVRFLFDDPKNKTDYNAAVCTYSATVLIKWLFLALKISATCFPMLSLLDVFKRISADLLILVMACSELRMMAPSLTRLN